MSSSGEFDPGPQAQAQPKSKTGPAPRSLWAAGWIAAAVLVPELLSLGGRWATPVTLADRLLTPTLAGWGLLQLVRFFRSGRTTDHSPSIPPWGACWWVGEAALHLGLALLALLDSYAALRIGQPGDPAARVLALPALALAALAAWLRFGADSRASKTPASAPFATTPGARRLRQSAPDGLAACLGYAGGLALAGTANSHGQELAVTAAASAHLWSRALRSGPLGAAAGLVAPLVLWSAVGFGGAGTAAHAAMVGTLLLVSVRPTERYLLGLAGAFLIWSNGFPPPRELAPGTVAGLAAAAGWVAGGSWLLFSRTQKARSTPAIVCGALLLPALLTPLGQSEYPPVWGAALALVAFVAATRFAPPGTSSA